METISEEVKDIFDDPDLKFGSILRILAIEFGEEASLQKINKIFQDSRPLPTHTINGETFVAGYRGPNIISEGKHNKVKLVELKQSGVFCKGMFVFSTGQFLYWSFPREEMRIEEIVDLSKKLNEEFTVDVKHEIIKLTGESHAKVVNFVYIK